MQPQTPSNQPSPEVDVSRVESREVIRAECRAAEATRVSACLGNDGPPWRGPQSAREYHGAPSDFGNRTENAGSIRLPCGSTGRFACSVKAIGLFRQTMDSMKCVTSPVSAETIAQPK